MLCTHTVFVRQVLKPARAGTGRPIREHPRVASPYGISKLSALFLIVMQRNPNQAQPPWSLCVRLACSKSEKTGPLASSSPPSLSDGDSFTDPAQNGISLRGMLSQGALSAQVSGSSSLMVTVLELGEILGSLGPRCEAWLCLSCLYSSPPLGGHCEGFQNRPPFFPTSSALPSLSLGHSRCIALSCGS